jgi:hypothetical protein
MTLLAHSQILLKSRTCFPILCVMPMDSDAFKIITVITTFDWPKLLLNLIREFKKQSKDTPHSISFVIYNDGSSKDYTQVRKELEDTNHIYLKGEKTNGKKGAINIVRDHRSFSEIWGSESWIDGNFLIRNECLHGLNYKLHRIPRSRWIKNESKSSGVWRQISKRLVKLGHKMYHIDESLAVRVHPFESKMNPEIRRKEPHFSLNVKGGSIGCPTCN